MLTFKKFRNVFLGVAILGAVSCFALRFSVVGQDAESNRSKLASLLGQRRDALKTRVEVAEALHKIAKTTPEAVVAARDDFFGAEYDLATSKAQRVGVLKQKLANAEEYESIMKVQKQEGRVSEADVLMAKARRLGVEIELLRAHE